MTATLPLWLLILLLVQAVVLPPLMFWLARQPGSHRPSRPTGVAADRPRDDQYWKGLRRGYALARDWPPATDRERTLLDTDAGRRGD